MSHLSSCEAFATDLNDLDAVLPNYGMELVRGHKTFRWYGQWVGGGEARLKPWMGKCEHMIRVKNAKAGTYEIGLIPRADGQPGWELIYDNWCSGMGLEEKAGAGLVNIKNGLMEHVTMKMLIGDGYDVRREIDPKTGEVVIVASTPDTLDTLTVGS